MSIGGGSRAETLASRNVANCLLTSATICSAESLLAAFRPVLQRDEGPARCSAPWPRKLQPVRKVTVSTPGRLARYSPTFLHG